MKANRFRFRAWDSNKKRWFDEFEVGPLGSVGHRMRGLYYALAEIKDFVLVQSTGLLDKQGKEIFEGDVLKRWSVYSDEILIVHWHEAGFRLFYPGDSFDQSNPVDTLDWEAEFDEIIGNIYENPELLENI